jgi:predicted AlkP superfamily phosphohydrolase/phosphomutase
MVIGLDCAEPSLVEQWRSDLPNLSTLIDRGVHGRLTSVMPPHTVPAWSCMMASRTPGDLGLYGFRNRVDHTYDGVFLANGTDVKDPLLWDLVGRAGGSSIVLGVPGTYPPRPLRGVLVTCFMTPSIESSYTYPPALRDEVEEVVGEYLFDCTDFRTEDKDDLLRQIYAMTERRFALALHLLETKPWQLFAMVEMGHDRVQHGFWKHMDPEHRKYVSDSPYGSVIRDYYVYVDGLLGRLLRHADEETLVFVLSDHGAKRLEGGIRLNEWFRREGFLATTSEPRQAARPQEVGIDWSKTIAWTDGGYYARIFLNVAGREPDGVIAPERYEAVRDDLIRRIEAIPDDEGRPLATRVYRPEEIYPQVNGVAPDLIVVFGDLLWRCVATIGGSEGLYTFDNDTGPDDANHAQEGIYIAAGAGVEARGRVDRHLLDVTPTVLELLGLEVPSSMRGASMAKLVGAGLS